MATNREAWLTKAAKQLIKDFPVLAKAEPFAVSCGWPSRSPLSRKRKRIGECWYAACSAGKRNELFISPVISDPCEVLAVLVHELVHPVAGPKAKHGPAFRKIALSVGLEGPMTATKAGLDLTKRLHALSRKLGPYPHSSITAVELVKKQGTRMLKAECSCGYLIRLTSKWAAEGLPTCVCGGEFQLA